MQKFLLAAALILAPTAANAEDWVLVSVTHDDSGAMFVDADSLGEPRGQIRDARVVAVAREDQNGIAAALGEMSFDCKARTYRFNATWTFDSAGRQGPKEPVSEWYPVEPGTLYEIVIATVCGEQPLGNEHYGAAVPVVKGRKMLEAVYVRDKAAQ